MARLSMNEMTTYRWSFDNDVAEYRAAGIPAIGVWRQKLSDYGEEKGIELLAETGLPVSNLLWAGGFTGSCGHSFRESVDDAAEAIRLAAALKAGCLVVYSGGRAGHTHNHARRLLIEAMRELVDIVILLRSSSEAAVARTLDCKMYDRPGLVVIARALKGPFIKAEQSSKTSASFVATIFVLS